MALPAKTGLARAAILATWLAFLPAAPSAEAKAVLVQARAEILEPARLQIKAGPDTQTAIMASKVHHQSRRRAVTCMADQADMPDACRENLFEFE